jgi:hypothetical protein
VSQTPDTIVLRRDRDRAASERDLGSARPARRRLRRSVLDSGWLDGLTINTLEASPASERERERQARARPRADPRGRHDQGVIFYNGNKALVTVHRTLTVFP